MELSNEDAYVKLDALISGIKMIDLHIHNFFQKLVAINNNRDKIVPEVA